MSFTPPVTLQISLAPSDHRLASATLPHQIRTWRGQVAEILLTIDLHRSAGRFADDWDEGRDKILA
ncbi:MAG: capsular biosynthesis protein, partial [Lacunisphaera sp.]